MTVEPPVDENQGSGSEGLPEGPSQKNPQEAGSFCIRSLGTIGFLHRPTSPPCTRSYGHGKRRSDRPQNLGPKVARRHGQIAIRQRQKTGRVDNTGNAGISFDGEFPSTDRQVWRRMTPNLAPGRTSHRARCATRTPRRRATTYRGTQRPTHKVLPTPQSLSLW